MTPEDANAFNSFLKFVGVIANSQIGLASLISAVVLLITISPWGIAPKLDELVRNTTILSERIARVMERCDLKPEESISQ